MQTETVSSAPPICVCRPSILGRRRWLLGGIALALLAGSFVWQWSWLVAIGVAPLLISTAPCLAMCALGLCMHRMGNRTSGAAQDGPPADLTSDNPSTRQES